MVRYDVHMDGATLVMATKLCIAVVLGIAMGTERSIVAHQQAGLRTFGLVALGACAFVIAGEYIDAQYIGVVNFDPMRIAAGIVQGVGFIGAGLIFMRGESVHGITTAAGLWVAASVGVLVAFGMYSIAIVATFLTILIFFGLWYVEQFLKRLYDTD